MKKTSLHKKLTMLVLGGIMALSVTSAPALAAEHKSMTLDESIQMALENNRTIKQSAADMDSAQWTLKEAKSGTGPTLAWSSTAEKVGGSYYSASGRDRDFTNKLTASLPIYTGGKLENTIKKAELGIDVSNLSLEQSKQSIKLKATKAYYSILQYRNLVQVDKESVDKLQEHLQNVTAQYNAGTVAKLDILTSQVNLVNAQQSLVTAQNNYDVAVSTFNNIVGLPTDTVVDVQEELKYEKYALVLPDCIDYALQHRPESVSDDIAVKQADAAIAAAKAGNMPQVSLTASDTLDGNDPFKKDVTDQWGVGLSASWNLFDNNVTKAQVKQAEAAKRKAEEVTAQQKETIQLDVRSAYLTMAAAEKNIQTTKTAVEQAQEAYKIAQVRYSSGVGTNVDVLDEQVALTTAQTNYIQALYDYNTGKASLDNAMGVPIDLDASQYVSNQASK